MKARTSAAELVERGHVRINGVRETSPGHAVKPGDVLTIALDRTVRVIKVIGFSERRGDASSARVLYEDLQQCRRSEVPDTLATKSDSDTSDRKRHENHRFASVHNFPKSAKGVFERARAGSGRIESQGIPKSGEL